MKITNVRIKLIPTGGRLKAVGSVTLKDAFVIHDVRVLEGENGMFVAMPSKKMPNGMFRDIAHPINSEMRTMIDDAVLMTFEEEVKKNGIEEESIEMLEEL